MKKYWKYLLIIFILLATFSLRFFPLRIAHFWDETVYLQHAEIMFSGRSNFSELDFRPPLLSIIFFLGFFIKHNIFTASFLTALLGTLVSLPIFLIAKKIYNLQIAILAALLSAFLPFLIIQSNYLLTDVPVIVFVGFAFYFALFKNKKSFLFLSGIFFGLAVLMKFTIILFFLILLIYLFIKKESLKNILLFCFGGAIILFPYFLWCYVQFGNPLTPFIVGQSMVSDKNESSFFYLSNFIGVFSHFIFIGLIFWIIHIILKIKYKNYFALKYDIIFLIWTFIFLIYLTKTPHKELRYILPITIPIILLGCKGWGFILYSFKKYKKLFWVLFIFYLIFLSYPRISYIKQTGFIDNPVSDEMKIADYLKEINYTSIIYSNQRWPVLAYYTGLETRPLFPDDSRIYELIPEKMKDPGLLIGMYDAVNYAPFKHPAPEKMNSDKRFSKITDIGNFFIYKYTPD